MRSLIQESYPLMSHSQRKRVWRLARQWVYLRDLKDILEQLREFKQRVHERAPDLRPA